MHVTRFPLPEVVHALPPFLRTDMMNIQTGELFPTREAALRSGVSAAFLLEVDPTNLPLSTRAQLERLGAAPAGQAVAVKIGRNDPCPCGSGLKFKKCHLMQRVVPSVVGKFHPPS